MKNPEDRVRASGLCLLRNSRQRFRLPATSQPIAVAKVIAQQIAAESTA